MESAFHRNLLIIALMINPFVMSVGLLWLGHRFDVPDVLGPAIALLSLAAGAWGAWLLPAGRWTRVAAILLYLPATILTAWLLMLFVSCGAYDVCL